MSLGLLIIFTIAILLLILIGAVSFAYVPMLFGVYGPAAKEPRGKLIMALLWLAPLFALVCLAIAWSSAAARYAVLLPAVYLLLLWAIRPNKQDGGGPQKRFAHKQQNVDEQLREEQDKWPSWLQNNLAKSYFCGEIWAPNLAQAEKVRAALLQAPALASSVKIVPQSNGSALLFVVRAIAVENAQRDEDHRAFIQQQIIALVNLAWQYGGELVATEVEAELSPPYR